MPNISKYVLVDHSNSKILEFSRVPEIRRVFVSELCITARCLCNAIFVLSLDMFLLSFVSRILSGYWNVPKVCSMLGVEVGGDYILYHKWVTLQFILWARVVVILSLCSELLILLFTERVERKSAIHCWVSNGKLCVGFNDYIRYLETWWTDSTVCILLDSCRISFCFYEMPIQKLKPQFLDRFINDRKFKCVMVWLNWFFGDLWSTGEGRSARNFLFRQKYCDFLIKYSAIKHISNSWICDILQKVVDWEDCPYLPTSISISSNVTYQFNLRDVRIIKSFLPKNIKYVWFFRFSTDCDCRPLPVLCCGDISLNVCEAQGGVVDNEKFFIRLNWPKVLWFILKYTAIKHISNSWICDILQKTRKSIHSYIPTSISISSNVTCQLNLRDVRIIKSFPS